MGVLAYLESMSSDNDFEVELPYPPNMSGVNVHQYGSNTEDAFEDTYHRYYAVPYYDEARRAFTHKGLNGKNEYGVNTWHEQLLAGRVTPEDMKTLGYSRLARFRKDTKGILVALHNGMDAKTMKAAMEAAERGDSYAARTGVATDRNYVFRYTLPLANEFGAETVKEILHPVAVFSLHSDTLIPLLRRDKAKALRLALYMDQYFTLLERVLGDKNIPTFLGEAFVTLMDNEITPEQAVDGSIRGLSAERTIEAIGITGSISEGVL